MRVIFGCDVDDFEDISEKPVRVSPAHVVHQDPAGPVLGEVLAVLRCQEVTGQLRSVATHLKPLDTWPEIFFYEPNEPLGFFFVAFRTSQNRADDFFCSSFQVQL